ncbi:sin3 histone deacetylase corepressor complex component SDS3-like isoform X2 [Ptychodera flava]|uniref:sin3 histone deacetylase corepressor complex component SDS3-like isoform X2 n=1 Tax=Ptychodera flava TaxID=63121 RepID=UPI00396A5DC7
MAASPYYSPGASSSNFNEEVSEDEGSRSYGSPRQSDEDTEDASETDVAKLEEEFTVMKEQAYQEKLGQLKRQLQQLQDGSHVELNKKLKKLEQQYKDRIRICEAARMFELEFVEREYIKEKKMSVKDFEDKKVELKENLIAELEEKKRAIESERHTMELTGDSMEVKPVATRKLRRRPNEPIPLPEKRRKPSPAHLNFLLTEDEIMDDLKVLNKKILKSLKNMKDAQGKHVSTRRANHSANDQNLQPGNSTNHNSNHSYECRIEDGKLFFDKRWYHRGQPIYYENKDGHKVSGTIASVGQSEVSIRKTCDNSKIRIYVSQLQKGKYVIKRRTT